MLKRFLLPVLILMTVLVLPGVAQQPSASPSPDRPITIFNYKTELGLTDDQVSKIQGRLKALQTQVAANRAKLGALQKEYSALVGNETTPLPTLEAKLREIAALQVASQMEDLKASRDILSILSADQLKKWRGIQAAARAQGSPK